MESGGVFLNLRSFKCRKSPFFSSKIHVLLTCFKNKHIPRFLSIDPVTKELSFSPNKLLLYKWETSSSNTFL